MLVEFFGVEFAYEIELVFEPIIIILAVDYDFFHLFVFSEFGVIAFGLVDDEVGVGLHVESGLFIDHLM